MLIAFVVAVTAVGAAQLLRQGLGVPLPAIALVLAGSAVILWRVSRRIQGAAGRRVAGRRVGTPAGTAGEAAGRWAVELLNLAFGLALAAVLTLIGLIGTP